MKAPYRFLRTRSDKVRFAGVSRTVRPTAIPMEEIYMQALDLRGLVPAPVTPFTCDGEVDHAAIQRLGSWLGSFKGVKGLVVLGHAGEVTLLTTGEQIVAIESSLIAVDGKIPVIA